MSHPAATVCPPGLPSPEAKARFDAARLLPRLLRAKGNLPRVSGLDGLQACGLLLPAGTGCTSLGTGLGNLTNRSEASWYLGGQKHSVTFRHVRLTERPCAVMTVRDPYERLRSGFRYDSVHMRQVTYATLVSNYQKRRTLRELLDAFRDPSAPGHATVMSMYNHSVTHPRCRSDEDQCVEKWTPEKPMNVFLWSQSAYLLDDADGSVPSIHFLCTNDYAASWRDLLADFGIESSVPAAHALSGRRPAPNALPYDDADARFVRDCLYPWDAYLHQRSLKGVSGDVIILEEAAYCDPGLVAEVVVPLLSMQQSVLLCISTILDSGNHYSKMMEMVDDYGHPIFESIKITLVCDECLKTDHPEKCRHKLASMPRWLSSKKVETVRALLAEDPAMLLRESLGISADGSEKAFHTTDIEAMMKRVPDPIYYNVREPTQNVNHVFVACDPSGGGASAFSVASLVQDVRGFSHVLGVEALHTKDVRQTHHLLVKHLATIRDMPVFKHCRIVLIFESNLAFESQHLLHAVETAGIKNWVSLSEGQQGSLGWLTTNERKAMTVGKIALAREFFSNELGASAAKQRIKDELSSYCVVTEAPKTTFGKVRQTYTGKLYGKQDDLCIAMQLSLIGCQKFFQDSKYRNFRAPDYLTPNGLPF